MNLQDDVWTHCRVAKTARDPSAVWSDDRLDYYVLNQMLEELLGTHRPQSLTLGPRRWRSQLFRDQYLVGPNGVVRLTSWL